MSGDPDIHELVRRVAVLEERMKTKQAEYRSDLAALMQEIADRNAESADRIAAMTDRVATATERMASSRWWQTAIMIAVVALVGTVVTGLPVLPEILSGLAAAR